jgi:hypothetical protein
MGVRADIREEVRKETVTKIHGQPTNQDLTILEKELIAILANIPTTLGGGNHGHAGILMEPTRYLLTTGVPFNNPANPGNYPLTVAGNAAAGVRARAEAEHKEEVREYETFQGVIQATKDIFLEAVDHEYLLEIEDEILGFLNQTPTDMLNHLRNRGGALDFADTKTLLAERDGEWDASEVPQLYSKNFKANMIEEQAEATEELIAALTEKHTQQIESLIKSNTEAMKQMMSLIKNDRKEPGDKKQPDEEKKKKREERRQRFNDAPVCKHCGKKHPTKKEDECWELEANKASRPVNWKSSKST